MSSSPQKSRSSFAHKKANPICYDRCEPRLLLASFTGTESDDIVSVLVRVNSVDIVINDTLSTFGSAGDVDIDGLGGINEIEISRVDGIDAVFENGRFEVGNFSFSFDNFFNPSFVGGFTVAGTAGDDVIEIQAFEVTDNLLINGTAFTIPFFFNDITFDGGVGQDRLITEAFDEEVSSNSNGRQSWINVEEVELNTRCVDSIFLTGTEGDDTLVTGNAFSENGDFDAVFSPSQGPEITLVEGSRLSLFVDGGDGDDTAFLSTGFSEVSRFVGSPISSQISVSGPFTSFSATVEGFENVTANSSGSITITGSVDDDTVVFSPDDESVEVTGDSFSIRAIGINRDDNVTLLGGGGNDSIQIDSTEAVVRRDILLDDNVIGFRNSAVFSSRTLRRLNIQDFSTVTFNGDEVNNFSNENTDAEFELDVSGLQPTLQYNDTTFNLSSQDEIAISGRSTNNDSLSIIAPPLASISVSASDLVAPNFRSSFSGINSVSVLGHDDGSEITFEGNSATERLNFDGENAVVSTNASTISTSNFTNTVVNARGGSADAATLTGDAAGGNTFVAGFDGAVSTGTITTPGRSLTAVGFDTLEAIAADENDLIAINGGDLREIATLGESEFEYAIGNQSIFGSGFALVDIDGGAGRNEVVVEHAFNVSLPEDGVGLHAGSAFRDPSYQLSSFPTVSFAEQNPRVFAIGADVNYVADYSAETASLQRTDNPTQILTTGDFQIFGTASDNDRLNIIAPESEDGTLSFNQFLSANVLAEWFFTETITVEGHNDSGEINILGNSGADTLIFNGQDALLDLSFGIRLGASEFNSIDVNPRGGDDRAFLSGAEGEDNTFEGSVSNNINVGVLRTPSTTITANNFELVGAIAGGENDQAILRGGLNPENLFAGPATARLVASNFVHNAAGFRNVIAQGGQGDFANLTDSQGDDQFTGNSNAATIVFDGGSSVTTTNFTTVRSVSSLGEDEALLEGSAGDDRFVAAGDRFGRLTGTGFSLVAVSYSSVDANGLSGNDIAFLSDSTGNDSFVGAANNSVLSGIGFENTAINFESVSGITSQGNDTAEFRGSQDAERFFASPAAASLTGDGFFLYGRGFDSVAAVGGGGQDIATLQDSEGNDNFTANVSSSVLAGAGFRNVATGFTTVRAFSLSGSDSAVFTGSAGDDQFSGLRPFSYLERAGVRTQANGFSNVFVTGLAGNDTASLFDSDEDETFFGANNNARIEGESYQIQVTDFEAIDLFGFNGGENRLVVNSNTIDYVFRDFGNWIS